MFMYRFLVHHHHHHHNSPFLIVTINDYDYDYDYILYLLCFVLFLLHKFNSSKKNGEIKKAVLLSIFFKLQEKTFIKLDRLYYIYKKKKKES